MLWWVGLAFGGEIGRVVNVGTAYTRVYAVEGEGGIVLVDAHEPGQEERILARVAEAGLDPAKITAIVLTHGHPDHAGSALALAERLDVPIVAGALDRPMLEAGKTELQPTGSRGRFISPFVVKSFPSTPLDVPVVDTLDLSVYGVGATAHVVGGHTPGALAIDLGDGVWLVGDLIRAHLFRRHTPTLHFFHDDPVRAHAALREIVADAVTVFPAHGSELDAGEVRVWLDERAPKHDARLSASDR